MADRDFTPLHADDPTFVSEAEYLDHYAEQHYEYVEGTLIPLSPAKVEHNDALYYLYTLLREYFHQRSLGRTSVGRVIGQPFLLRLTRDRKRRYREPDLLVVLEAHLSRLSSTMTEFADVCIEIVSDESRQRNTETKFQEYQRLGIPEYWLFDLEAPRAIFYRLNSAGMYEEGSTGDIYTTPLLPRFRLHIPTLWQDELPSAGGIARSVAAMLVSDPEE